MKKLSVMGAGNYCLDTIVKREYPEGFVVGKRNKFVETVISEEIGSNPGNVLCILGHFGWESYPIALFDDSPEGLKLTSDFQRYHCNTRFVTNTPEGGTNLLKVTHCLDDKTGLPVTKFSKRHAPNSGFPKDKSFSVMGKDATLPKFIASLDILPDVYFFEGTTPCWRNLAAHFRSKGVLIYYEIQRYYEKEASKYISCIKQCDILKFSNESIQTPAFDELTRDKLVIQTLGAKGVRFNLRGAGWVTLPPVENDGPVVDTEGCGDWTTASFINALGQRGILKLADITDEVVRECLMEAQGYAARNVSYIGTKSMIAESETR